MTEAALNHNHHYAAGGVWSWITTVDAKRIGVLYGVTALVFAVFAGIEAMMIRTQLIVPNNTFLDADTFNAFFTMHGLIMIFGFLMPINAAFFNFIVPLQIGARDVAFPRLNALSQNITRRSNPTDSLLSSSSFSSACIRTRFCWSCLLRP